MISEIALPEEGNPGNSSPDPLCSHAPDKVEDAIDQTLTDLGLDYLDLYHMHWPVASTPHGDEIFFVETWKAMIQLLQSGKTRHIGVSNFSPAQLEKLLNSTMHPPSVHQMELHPYLQQSEWVAFHKTHGIHVTAYSPLGGTNPTCMFEISLRENTDVWLMLFR